MFLINVLSTNTLAYVKRRETRDRGVAVRLADLALAHAAGRAGQLGWRTLPPGPGAPCPPRAHRSGQQLPAFGAPSLGAGDQDVGTSAGRRAHGTHGLEVVEVGTAGILGKADIILTDFRTHALLGN